MIKRREFGAGLVGMAALGMTRNSLAAAQTPRKNTLMHVGGDYHNIAGGLARDIELAAQPRHLLAIEQPGDKTQPFIHFAT